MIGRGGENWPIDIIRMADQGTSGVGQESTKAAEPSPLRAVMLVLLKILEVFFRATPPPLITGGPQQWSDHLVPRCANIYRCPQFFLSIMNKLDCQ
jgi:hypothetical protein